jgi:hypothetical protein
MFIDSEPSTLQFIADQVGQWLNHLTLPAIAFGAWKGLRWVQKKEAEAKGVVDGLIADVAVIKNNHLSHIQESLDGLKTGQDETNKLMNENTKDIVGAINSSKDALVNAFLAAKN